jgi:hypothetical protein
MIFNARYEMMIEGLRASFDLAVLVPLARLPTNLNRLPVVGLKILQLVGRRQGSSPQEQNDRISSFSYLK